MLGLLYKDWVKDNVSTVQRIEAKEQERIYWMVVIVHELSYGCIYSLKETVNNCLPAT